MIQGNQIYQDYKLERENYLFDDYLTQNVLTLPQFTNEVVDDKFLLRVMKYVNEKKLLKSNQKMTIGYKDIDGERCRKFGIFVYTNPIKNLNK